MRKFTYGHVWKLETRHFVFNIIIVVVVIGGGAAAAIAVVCFGICVQFMHWKKVETTYCKDKFHFFHTALPSPNHMTYTLTHIAYIHAHIFFHLIRHLFTLNVFIS